jgi:hypothetical protein
MRRRSPIAVPLEHDEQATVIKWCDQYARLRWPWLCLLNGDFAIYATPNGGERNIIVATRLKAEGVSTGVPDLHVPGLRLWIEMKRIKGSVTSDKQKDWHAYLRSIGDTVVIAKGAAEAIVAITETANKKTSIV